MFTSPHYFLDTTNGAAASMRALLVGLARKGHSVEAITGCHSPDTVSPSREGLSSAQELCRGTIRAISAMWEGIQLTVLTGGSPLEEMLVPQEILLPLWLETHILEAKPDVLLFVGRPSALARVLHLTRAAKVPVAYYLNTVRPENHPGPVAEADLVIVPSYFLAARYRECWAIEAQVLHPIIDLTLDTPNGDFVTHINPAPEKGLALVHALATRAESELPEARFLIVEGRWTGAAAAASGFPVASLSNVTVAKNTREIRELYARTRVLLYPSFWEEAYGRVVVEAQRCGIPVLAARRGGIPEAMNGGGILLEVPERSWENYRTPLTHEEVTPWLDALTRMLMDPAAHAEASRQARAAAPLRSGVQIEEAASVLSAVASRRAGFGAA